MLGDGNIWKKKGFYYTRICGHSEEDKEYLLNHVNSLSKKLFGINFNTYKHKKNKELFLTKGSKDLIQGLQKLTLEVRN